MPGVSIVERSGFPIHLVSLFVVITLVVLFIGFVLLLLRGSRRLRMKIALLTCSLLLTTGCCELMLRLLTVYPVHGNSNVIAHGELGYVLDPALPDVDDNGFRNSAVTTAVQLVAIGDSHTQGFNVESQNSWPVQLGRMLNRTVYNFGIGGYGPLHYERLIHRALTMQPELIVVGLFLPNDLSDTVDGIHPRLAEPPPGRNVAYWLRDRTALGSMLWQIIQRSRLNSTSGITVDNLQTPTFLDARAISSMKNGLDLSRPEIAAAFDRTLQIIRDADTSCRNQNCRLFVLIIPSKERVYSKTLESSLSSLPSSDQLVLYRTMVEREQQVTAMFTSQLTESRIAWADVSDALSEQLNKTPHIYPSWSDGHPLEAGYREYAQFVARALISFDDVGVVGSVHRTE